ncbi:MULTISPECIES: hypothetical protein [Protofrankia]|uniref:Lipoprotein n=1 Tax=Candidatus Protofrankia datiscae TaxID=2716812 RepID=F8AZ81_9ACTN|nr:MULTISPECIES: hypothetical protein [Protofrankia]AEH10552.1 hypothetical protein FsymDg_3246 [Candidatus Protofrankia datiscae]
MRTDSGPPRHARYLLVAAVVMLAVGCGGGAATTGAPAPPRAQSFGPTGQPSGPVTGDPRPVGSVSQVVATPSRPPAADPTRTALATVQAYFTEINTASREGRVADVSLTAMPGCQTCMLDVGVTRGFHDRGGHADVDPLAVGPVVMDPLGDRIATARTTVAIRAVRLLDAAGNTVRTYPAQPARAATATLVLSSAGWRIQNVLYATGSS